MIKLKSRRIDRMSQDFQINQEISSIKDTEKNKCKPVRDTGFFLFLAALFLVITFFPYPAAAGILDSSKETYENKLVDKSITPKRVDILEKRIVQSGGTDTVSIEKLNSFSKNTVFWIGTVQKFVEHPDNFWFLLLTNDNTYVWVHAHKKIKNLNVDRTGYTVGVKGKLVFEKNALLYNKAQSVVLIDPPKELSYANFLRKHNLSTEFTLNTTSGMVTVNHKYYPFIVHRIYIHNPNYQWDKILSIAKSIIYFCYRYPTDPLLMTALINIESAFDVNAVSSAGAIGLGQLMPGTAAGLGVNPHDNFQNVGGAVRYFNTQLRRWEGHSDQLALALASYNAGPGAVSRYGRVPPFSETQNYVYFIKTLYDEYLKQYHRELNLSILSDESGNN
jgi:hypothetical protein